MYVFIREFRTFSPENVSCTDPSSKNFFKFLKISFEIFKAVIQDFLKTFIIVCVLHQYGLKPDTNNQSNYGRFKNM